MIYVYAITSGAPPRESIDVPGVGDAPPAARDCGPVAAVYGDVDRSPRPTRDAVWRHEKVVERVMADHAVLPARFGTVLRDVDALDEVLARNGDRLAAGLDRVRGCVELGVRVLWHAGDATAAPAATPAPLPEGAGPGRAYLAARAEKERERRRLEARAGELAADLHRLFLPCAKDGVVRVLPTPEFVMAGAYLVPREKIGEFRSRVEEAGAAFHTLRLLCTGPWPPYHFVPELSLAAAPVGEVQRA